MIDHTQLACAVLYYSVVFFLLGILVGAIWL
jgi:hypothetical protein